MWTRLKQAAEEGIVLGVKVGIALAIAIAAVSWMLGDYTVVRQRAQNGQAAFEYLQQKVAAQQKAAPKEAP